MTNKYGVNNGCAFVIPALNEERSIGLVVHAVAEHGLPIVVDDGSTDGTACLARKAGADVVSHPHNLGYDAALESGLIHAITQGMSIAIVLDGDGQHSATAVNEVLKILIHENVDLVLGVRDHFQRVSEQVFAKVGTLRWGLKDPLCGIKGYRLARLAALGKFNTYTSVGTEAAIRMVLDGATVRQIPIKVLPRRGVSRFGAGWQANVKIFKALLQALRLRPGRLG